MKIGIWPECIVPKERLFIVKRNEYKNIKLEKKYICTGEITQSQSHIIFVGIICEMFGEVRRGIYFKIMKRFNFFLFFYSSFLCCICAISYAFDLNSYFLMQFDVAVWVNDRNSCEIDCMLCGIVIISTITTYTMIREIL